MTPRYARLLALVALGMLVASGPAFAQTDYDSDNDGYIDVANLAQLNAIRWDLNGDGVVSSTDSTNYFTAFSNPASGMGCPSSGCNGYELLNNLDFDENNDNSITSADATYWNNGAGWLPIGGTYTGNFKGNGYTIDNLFINRGSASAIGLFYQFGSSSRVETLGIINANVTLKKYGGILVYQNSGTIVACYTTGTVTGEEKISGLVGWAGTGSISTSYSHASVTTSTNDSDVGGLVGEIWGNAIIRNSYFAGTINGTNSAGGLVGDEDGGSAYDSYWDSSKASGTIQLGSGQSTTTLQGTTGYTGIYANWNLDLDGNTNTGDSQGRDDPWNFGTSSQYPVLKYVGPSAVVIDHDGDNDGLIDIKTLAQLNAIRHDLNGNGDATHADYAAAFPGRVTTSSGRMGCPSGTCTGYELLNNLDFDENNDGAITQADTTYWNSGAGWDPLGTYTGTFKGNNKTISHLFINRGSRHNTGLFQAVDGDVSGLGLLNVDVTGRDRVGGLAGNQGGGGTISSCYVTGRVSGSKWGVGGLVGRSFRTSGTNRIVSSYARVSVRVPASVTSGGMAGGLVGWLTDQTEVVASYAMGSVFVGHSSGVGGGLVGQIASGGGVTASYSIGRVTGAGTKGGLVGSISGTVTDSYWDTQESGIADDGDTVAPEGKLISDLQSVTSASGIYANWDDLTIDASGANDDDPWTFGTTKQYPVLTFADMDTTVQFAIQPVHYDTDSDGLLEVSTLAQLHAMRWDLNGDGVVADSDAMTYNAAFPNGNLSRSKGCPSTGCIGYELLANLDFDTSGDGEITSADATYWNGGAGWAPIGSSNTSPYTATFEGNGKTISHLYINRYVNFSGFFASTDTTTHIRSLGLVNAVINTGQGTVGALVGLNKGRIAASYVTGSVTASTNVGGLAGATQRGSYIVASYATASVVCNQSGPWSTGGGLVGANGPGATIASSYSTGSVTGACLHKHGLAENSGTVTDSYWDTQTSDIADDSDTVAPEGKLTSDLQSVTSASGIYANWDDLTIDASGANDDDPWTFGTTNQYPALKFAGLDTTAQFATQPVHYDTDSDGLLEVSTLAQLHAMRWDLNGDGVVADSDAMTYNAAFPNGNLSASKGCPSTGCIGYELLNNLDFDENNDGAITQADATYWNSGAGWDPVGPYGGTFKGNNKTISHLFINRGSRHNTGLFHAVDGDVSGLGLLNVNVTGADRVGGLAGNQGGGGTISSCYVTGRVSGSRWGVGGLVGRSYRTSGSNRIVSSYALVSVRVPAHVTSDGLAGGLVGWLTDQTEVVASYALGSVFAGHSSAVGGGLVGQIASNADVTASYAIGRVTGAGTKGGLVGSSAGTVTDSHWDTSTSGQTTSAGGSGVVGKTTSDLLSPTTYGATANDTYYNWNANLDGQPGNDDPWTFGAMDQYPALKYAGMDTTAQFQLQPARVTLTLMPSSISESGGMGTVTATLAHPLSAATTITVRPVAGAYTVGSDTTITIAAGSTANATDTVVITAVNNTQDEPNRDVTVSVVAGNAQGAGSVTGATLTLEDDDPAPTATLAASPASISENGAVSTITASLSRPSSAATTITVRPVAGAYTVGADTTITIAAGDTINASDTVVITAVNNTQDAPNRDVTVLGVMSNTQGAGSVTGAALTLTDDDVAPDVTMVLSPASISEDGAISTVTATLSHTSSAATTITVSASAVSPAVPGDYMLSTPATLTVAAGATTSTGTVTITTVDNSISSGNKTVTVSSTVGNSIGTGSVTDATLTIIDDEVAQVTLVLTPASITENAQISTITATLDRVATVATTVTVSATPVAPAVAGDFTLSTATTLTFAANVTTSTGAVTITSVNDTTDAPDKRVTVSATVAGGNGASLSSAVTLTITDDEAAPDVALTLSPASIAETGGVSTITATLSHRSSAATTITVRPVAGAYTVGMDSTITIAAGSTANATDTVEITAVDNATDAPNNSLTVSVAVSNDQGAGNVTGTALTITDDDAAPDVTLMLSPASISEDGGVSTVTATLTHPSSEATTITVRPVANAYTVGSDSTITIAAGSTANATDTVALTAVDNDIDASDNAVMVQTAAVENDHGAGNVQATSLTITDDDEAAIEVSAMTTTTVRLHTTESGRAETFTVTLASEPTGNVALSVVSSDTTEGTVSPSVLTFSSTTWSTAQTVTVTGQDDTPAAVDGNQNYTVTLSVNQTDTQDTNYDALTAIIVYMVNRDNDFGLDISAVTGQATEAGASATFTVALLTQPSAAVTISVTSQDPSEGRVEPAMLTFAPTSYNTAQTVTVTGQDDIIDDGNVTWTVRLALSSGDANYNTLSDEDVPVTTTDDEDAPTVTLVLTPSSISENGEVSTVSATLSHPSSGITTITVSATPVSPATASDFTLSSADTLIIAATTTTSTGTVTITAEDNNDQADEKMVRVSATANNAQGITDPSPVTLTLTDDETPSANLDVDGDGRVRLFSDIILVIRYVLFFREEALLRGNVIEPTATRTTAQEIEPYLDTLVNQNILDVDGDGDVRLFSDIILIIRYVLFFRNEALVRGNVIEPTATRTTSQAIEPYIRSLYPASHFQ